MVYLSCTILERQSRTLIDCTNLTVGQLHMLTACNSNCGTHWDGKACRPPSETRPINATIRVDGTFERK